MYNNTNNDIKVTQLKKKNYQKVMEQFVNLQVVLFQAVELQYKIITKFCQSFQNRREPYLDSK